MPTKEQQDELRNECTWTWTKMNGVNGYNVTGPNGNTLFLPTAGFRVDNSFYDTGVFGNYWSCSLDTSNPYYAYLMYFGSGGVYCADYTRDNGYTVRPVRVPQN